MAISTPTLTGKSTHPIEVNANRWAVNFHSDDFGAGGLNEEIKAAPSGTGRATYLTHVTMGIVADSVKGYEIDCKLSLIDGAGSTVFGPIQFQAQGTSHVQKDFDPPLKITDEKALDCTGVYGGGGYDTACFVYIEGFTGDKPLG